MNEYLDNTLDFIKIISFLFSVIALYVSLKVYRLFYYREIRKKQLELVLKLIKDFQEFEYEISFHHYNKENSSSANIIDGNIFSLKNKEKISILKQDDVTELPVYLTEEVINQFNISDYLHNPLMPNEISTKLRNIFPNKIIFSNVRTLTDDYFIIIKIFRIFDSKEADIRKKTREEGLKTSYVIGLGIDYGSFMKNIEELKNELNKWLKKIGIKDLNLKWDK